MILAHFKFKKEEIIEVVNSWIKESKKFTKEMTELLNEFIELVSL